MFDIYDYDEMNETLSFIYEEMNKEEFLKMIVLIIMWLLYTYNI